MSKQIGPNRHLTALVGCPWFKGVDESELSVLSQHATTKTYQTGDFIYRPGEKKTLVYHVLGGRVRRSITSSEGQELSLVDLVAGEWIGDAIANDRPLHLDIRAVEPSELLAIPGSLVVAMADRHLEVYRNLYHAQTVISRDLLMVAEVLAFAPLRSRLAERILDLAEKHGQVVEGGTCIAHSLSQNDLALLSFGSRPRVNRILKEWADRGILVSDSKRYLVKDFDALRQESTQHYS